jgi:DNA adenine methylase
MSAASVNLRPMRAPFPYFGGKRTIAETVWRAFGRPKQYIEPFCGSAAILLSAPEPASLEVIGDANGFIANFWRAVVAQADEVARWADYPVSHVDLGARHVWMMGERERVGEALQDPHWPGDAKLAGWWLWGQCAWIGSGWCEWTGKVPHVSDAGMGIQATGQVPHVSDAGMGIQATGQVPHVSNAGRGADLWTSGGRTAMRWLRELADRMERVRVVHGSWGRCLNSHYGADLTAIFLDPPYKAYEKLYGVSDPVAAECEAWARDNASLRVALCGHRGDYDLPGWTEHDWERGRLTYNGGKTTAQECIWFSPACLPLVAKQPSLFGAPA